MGAASIGNLGPLLGYGVSGLGLALAILAYRLLTAEQRITKPRSQIITSIYVFMVFSLVLTGLGLYFELSRLSCATQLPANASDQQWYDVLKATRKKIFDDSPSKEYTRGVLEVGESAEFPIEIHPGDCRGYMVMTKPPARISIEITSPQAITHTQLGREGHLAYGRICAPKSPISSSVNLRVTMANASGPYVAEAYEVQP